MALPYARKVDQQCLYLQQLLELAAAQQASDSMPALLQAGYLQLEMAMRFYLLELVDKEGKEAVQIGLIDRPTIERLYQQTPSVEVAELVDLLQTRTSWLACWLDQLCALRRVEQPSRLKGSIFQLEEQESAGNMPVGNMIAARDLSSTAVAANIDDLNVASEAFEQLLVRQRAVREEY